MRQGNDLVLIRPRCSVRDHERVSPGFVVTKGGGEKWPSLEVESALDIEQAAEGATVVWLDEPFMFQDQKKLYAVVKRLRRRAHVLISTITATSEMEPISPSVSALMAVADEVHLCRADCDDCQRLSVATRSWHLDGPKKEKVKVGGEDAYEPKCPSCWERLLNQSRSHGF